MFIHVVFICVIKRPISTWMSGRFEWKTSAIGSLKIHFVSKLSYSVF